MMSIRSWFIGLALTASRAMPAAAQRNEVTVEASVLRGTVGYARALGPRTLLGGEVGFGFPQIDRTLSPATRADGSPDGRRIKVGARLTAGWIGESEAGGPRSSSFTAGLNPFIIRATLPW
jgi:hypothetical protein